MRKAFSLVFAIVFLVAIATVGILSLNIVSLGTKDTQDLYIADQADLLAQSATEYAIWAIQRHNYEKDGCLQRVQIKYPDEKKPLFEANVDIGYILKIAKENSDPEYKIGEEDEKNRRRKGHCGFLGEDENRTIAAVRLDVSVEYKGGKNTIRFTRTTTQIP